MKSTSIGILHYSAPPVVGGVEAVIQAHLRVFRKHRHPVRVIAGRGDPKGYPLGAELHLIPEIDSQHPAIVKIGTQLERGWVPDDFEPMVQRLVGALAPMMEGLDHLIVHNVFTKHFNLPLTAALYHLLDEGVIRGGIAWCHDFTWTSPSSRTKVHPGYPWDLLRSQRVDVRYVVVSKQRQATLANLYDCHPDEIQVIYNGVDPKILLGLSEEGEILVDRLELFKNDLIILMPVRVTQAKNIEYALRVVAALKAERCRPKLILTGPPDPHDPHNLEYYAGLKRLRDELGVTDEMRFLYESGPENTEGYTVGLPLIGELYRVSDLIFMPSHREGFGMPILEAGLAGVPVVTTEVPAAMEIGGAEVVLIQTSLSPETVAQKILKAVSNNPSQRLRTRVRHRYTWEALYRQEIRPLLQGKQALQ